MSIVPNLDLVAGQDLRRQIDAYEEANLHGNRMDPVSRHALEEYTRGFARENGLVFRNKVAVVIISIQDVIEEEQESTSPSTTTMPNLGNNPSSHLIHSMIQTTLSSTTHGHLILVTLGLSLCEAVVATMGETMVLQSEWESFTLLPINEFEGYSSAINQAMALAPPDSIISIFTPSFSPYYGSGSSIRDHGLKGSKHHANSTTATCDSQGVCHDESISRDDDIFVRYESLGEGGGRLLVTIPPPIDEDDEDDIDKEGCWDGIRLPLLIFDDKTYQALGPLDEVSKW